MEINSYAQSWNHCKYLSKTFCLTQVHTIFKVKSKCGACKSNSSLIHHRFMGVTPVKTLISQYTKLFRYATFMQMIDYIWSLKQVPR